MTSLAVIPPIAVELVERVVHDHGCAVERHIASVGVSAAAELGHLAARRAAVLLAHRELRELLSAGVLEDDGGGGRVRDAGGGLAGLEVLQLQKGVADLRGVGGIAVEGVHGPSLLPGGEREGLRAADLDAGDVRDVEGGEYLPADEVGGLLRTALEQICRAEKRRGGNHEYEKFFHVNFLCDF